MNTKLKRFLSMLLVFVMVFSMMPANAETAATDTGVVVTGETPVETPAAKIGDTEYATLTAAFEAAEGGNEIVLLRDVDEVVRLSVSEADTVPSIILNLNGKTWDCGYGTRINAVSMIVKNGTIGTARKTLVSGDTVDVFYFGGHATLPSTMELTGVTFNAELRVNNMAPSDEELGLLHSTVRSTGKAPNATTVIIWDGQYDVVTVQKAAYLTIYAGWFSGIHAEDGAYVTDNRNKDGESDETEETTKVEEVKPVFVKTLDEHGYVRTEKGVTITFVDYATVEERDFMQFTVGASSTTFTLQRQTADGWEYVDPVSGTSTVKHYFTEPATVTYRLDWDNNGTYDRLIVLVKSPVAQVDDTPYTSIDEAVAAWTDGTTLTILTDVEVNLGSPLALLTDTEITLEGKNITADEGKSALVIESGNVILNVNADTTLTGGKGGAGIYVAEGASVTIKGTGTLTAIGNGGVDTTDSGAAGIGGTYANGNSGTIIIDGATVVAKGYGVHGSGIGSGSGKVVGEIKIINGANVTAYGGYYADGAGTTLQSSYGKSDPEGGAAIGGGGKTASTIANITITDSTVVAYGGSKAAGIGANFWSNCGTITISGDSNVTAQGGSSSAGIGTSRAGDAGVTANIVISGGTVTATGGAYGAGIGGGYNADSLGNGAEASALPEISVTISGGTITATGGEGGAGIGGGYKTDNVDIDITGGTVTAQAGALVSGKTIDNGGEACAIGSGANGSGVFENSPAVEIADAATVTATTEFGGKAAIEGFADEDWADSENVTVIVNGAPITGTITGAEGDDLIWSEEDGDKVGPLTIAGNVTITVIGKVPVVGTIRMSPDCIVNVKFVSGGEFNGNTATLIRDASFTGQMFYVEGVSGNFQNLTFSNITLDGGAVWTGAIDGTLNRGTTNSGVKATGSVLYLVYANADLNGSTLQNHDDSTGEKANAVFLRYYSTIDFNGSVVRNNNSISTYYRGGVVTIRQGGTVTTSGADVYGNSGMSGGFVGISSTGAYGGVVKAYNSKFHNNYADNGAVFLMQCNSNRGYLEIDGCEFYNNASKTAVLTEWAYSRPFIISNSYFHDNECAVWDCHADPVLDLSGKIVVTEDGYTKYLFETPLALGGALADGSSIEISEATLTKLMSCNNGAGFVVTGTKTYAVTEDDLAKFVKPEGYVFVKVDNNSDGINDYVLVKGSEYVDVTVYDNFPGSEDSETQTLPSSVKVLPAVNFVHGGFTFKGWMTTADGTTIISAQMFTEETELYALWTPEAPVVTLGRADAEDPYCNTLLATITNKFDNLTYTYQWYMNDVEIEGATEETYAITETATYKCVVTVTTDGFEPVTGSASGSASYLVRPVAQIGDVKYETLDEALTAAVDGDTIELLWAEGDAPIAMNGSVYGKSVTITGTAQVDWSKGWLFVGRGGEGDGKLTFSNATLTSTEASLNNGSYGIHVSMTEHGSSNKYDGTVVFENSNVELSYLMNKNAVTVNGGNLTISYGFAVGARPVNETNGIQRTATMNVCGGAVVVVKNHNGMGVGYESNGILKVADATFTCSNLHLTDKGEVILTDVGAVVTAPEGLNVTTDVVDYEVVYGDGSYTLVEKVYVAQIGDVKYETLDEAFEAAFDGDEVKILAAGTYTLSTSGKNITITGAVDGVVFDNIGAKNMGGANVTFNNVTFDYYPNVNYTGLQHSGNLVYNDCTFEGQVFLYGASETFNRCTFNQNSADAYNVWTYGAKNVKFDDCTFNCVGKSVLVYNEGACANNVTVTDSAFVATSSVEGKAAIEIDTTKMPAGTKVEIKNTTDSGFAAGSVSGETLWNDKKDQTNLEVWVDDEQVWPIFVATVTDTEGNVEGFVALKDAFDAAEAGDTVTIFAGDYTENVSVGAGITVVGETDEEGNNLVNITGKLSVSGQNATVKNLNVSNPSDRACVINGGNILIEGCNLTGSNGLRYCYANDGDVTIKDCVVTGDVYGVHFDAGSGEGDVIIDGCTITGWTSFGSAIEGVTITDTTFMDGNYDQLRFFQDATVTNCTFPETMNIDFGTEEVTVKFDGCTVGESSSVADVVYLGDIVEMGVKVYVDGVLLVVEATVTNAAGEKEYFLKLAEAIEAAQSGDTVTILTEGPHKLPGFSKDLTIEAAEGVAAAIDMPSAVNLRGSNVVFNGLTFNYTTNANYIGLQEVASETYNNCVINGQMFAYGNPANFTDCEFNQTSTGAYNIWTYGADNATFTNCDFNSAGKAMLIYNEGDCSPNVTVTGCTFTASESVDGKAAIEIDTSLMKTGKTLITITDTTATGFAAGSVSGETLWNDKKDLTNLDVYVDGEHVWPIFVAQIGETQYTSLAKALEAAQDGDTILVLKNHELSAPITVTKTVTIDLGGCEVSYSSDVAGEAMITNKGNLTLTGEGKINYTYTGAADTSYSKGNYTISNGGTLTVSGPSIVNSTAKMSHACYTIDNNSSGGAATLIVDAGEVINQGGYAIRQFVNGNANIVTINGGNVTGTRAVWMQLAGSDTSKAPVAELNVTGGTLTATGENGGYKLAVYSYNYGNSLANTKINITGGTLNGDVALTGGANKTVVETVTVTGGKINDLYSYGADELAVPAIALTGGTFNTNDAEYYALDDGYLFRLNAEGTYDVVEGTYVAQIGETKYETLDEAFTAAVDDDEVIILVAGTYALSTSGKNITITGAVDGVVFDNIGAKNMGGANVTFNNVTFDYATDSTYKGLQHSGDLTYNNCTFNGQVFLYGTSETFTNCTFNTTDANNYNVWTYGADNVTFSGCTFNCAGKSVLLYTEGANDQTNLNVVDCDFIASAPVEGKAAIEIDTSLMVNTTSKVTIDAETTVTGFGTGSVSGETLWNDKKNKTNIEVWVAGEQVWPIFVATVTDTEGNVEKFVTLEAAAAAAQDGEIVTLLDNITLTDVVNIENAITLNLGGKTLTGADGAIVLNIKADTTIKNGTITGNKSGTTSGLIDIYADLTMEGVTVTTSKINALRFKAGECTATLTDCTVTGAFKGYGGSVWNIQSGTYMAASTAINDQLNGSAAISGGTFHYEIEETECAPGYTVVDNGDGTWTVKYAPACFIDANNNGVLDEGEAVYASLEPVFANHTEGDVYVVLTADIAAKNQVDTDVDAHYYFSTNVAGGAKMDFLFADNWNYVQKMTVGENITLTAPYLLAWTELNINGKVDTGYAYFMGADVTVAEGAELNVITGDATVQVKSGANLTVNGTVNASTINVWVGEAKLTVSGANAKVDASWIDIWDGTPSVVVEDGATLTAANMKASRGGTITVDAATLDAVVELGHNGDSKGEMTILNDGTIAGANLTTLDSTVTGPEGLTTITTDIADHKVVYEEGVYKVAPKTYVAETLGVKYETLAEALEAAEGESNIVVNLLADATLDITSWQTLAIGGDSTTSITINGNGNKLTFNKLDSDWSHVATNNGAKLILNNMTITDSGYNNGPWNRYDINFACPVELNNVTSTKALAFKAGATLNDVTIDESGDNYAIWIQPNGQTVSIDGLDVNSAGRGIKIDEQYVDAAVVNLTVKNADFDTAKKGAILVKSSVGANITVENVDISGVAADTTNVVWNDEDAAVHYGKVKVNGGTKIQEGDFAVAIIKDAEVWAYYKTLPEAVEAVEDGEIIWLAANIELTEAYELPKSITLETKGYTLKGELQLNDAALKLTSGDANLNVTTTVDGSVVLYDDGAYSVCPKPELPTATVTELENDALTFALNFVADPATDAQLLYYGGWYADFVLTLNKDATFNANGNADGYLGGQYDLYSENWVYVPFSDVTMTAGESLKIMEYAAELMGEPGLKFTYGDVYNFVKDFDCGVFFTDEYLEENKDLVVTLELRVYNPKDETESYVIGKTYVFRQPSADMTYSAYGFNVSGEGEKYRERFGIDLYNIYARKTLVIELYDEAGNLLATTSMRETDRDDGTAFVRPIQGSKTVNIVVDGRLAGSWDTEWAIAPSVDYIPYTAKIYADGVLVDTYYPVFDAEDVAEYVALPGVAKVASVTDAEGNVTYYGTLDKAFAAADDGDEVEILVAGTYALSTSGKNITITGAVDGVVFDNIGAKNMGGANVTFNNVTFNYASDSTYKGLQHSGDLTYNNCTFNGQVFLYGTSETFTNCTFNTTDANNYNVWTYGAKNVEFNECEFNCAGKSVLVYNEGACANNVTVTDSSFVATSSVEGKAAIEIDTTKMPAGTKVEINNTTDSGFAAGSVSGETLWNDKKDQTNLEVWVDDVQVWPIFVAQVGETKYTTFKAALEVAQANTDDKTVILLEPVTITADTTYDLTGVTVTSEGDAFIVTDGTLTLDGGVVKAGTSGTGSWNAVWANGGKVVINGGTYSVGGDTTTTDTTHQNDVIYTKNGGTVTITGGTFLNDGYVWTLNQNDSTGGAITVTGGTFHNWNPENNVSEGQNTSFLPEGYIAVDNGDNSWTVTVGEWVAQIGETKYATLQAAADAAVDGDTIVLLTNIAEDVVVEQKPDVKITIDGAGKTIDGTITVNGKSARYATAGLTIQNVNFNADTISEDAFINLGGNNNIRYTSNVTISNCTFTAAPRNEGIVAIKQYTGGCKNLTVENCTATGVHSLIQLKNVEAGLSITGCTITDSKNGISVGNSVGAAISGCTMDVDGYGIRADGNIANKLTVSDCTITAEMPIVVRKTTAAYELAISGTNELIAGNTEGYQVIFTNDDDGTYVEPTGAFVYTADEVNAELKVFPKYVAVNDGVKYTTFEAALAAAQANADDKTVILLEPVTITADTTYDLTDVTVTSEGDAFIVTSGTLTLNGGVVKAGTSGAGSWNAVWANGGDVVINGGTYSVGGDSTTTDTTHQNDVIYTKNGGTVTITGGTFLNNGTVWTLNQNDSTGGAITVTGGTFQGWNPADNVSEGPNTNFVADGYISVDNGDGTWTVQEHMAMIHLMAIEVSVDSEQLLRLKFVIDEEFFNDANAYMVLTEEANAVKPEQTRTYTAADIQAMETDANGRYVFEQGIAAGEMTGDVTITFYDGEGNVLYIEDYADPTELKTEIVRTVVDYAELALTKGSTRQKNLAAAMITFGGYAQQMFNCDAGNPAYGLLDELGIAQLDISSVTADSINNELIVDGADIGITYKSQQVVVDSSIYMRTYFDLEAGMNISDYTFTVTAPNGAVRTVTPELLSGSRYMVDILNIPVARWDNDYVITVTNANGETYVVTSSVLAYVKRGIAGSTNAAQVNAFKAMVLYNEAANAYFPGY